MAEMVRLVKFHDGGSYIQKVFLGRSFHLHMHCRVSDSYLLVKSFSFGMSGKLFHLCPGLGVSGTMSEL